MRGVEANHLRLTPRNASLSLLACEATTQAIVVPRRLLALLLSGAQMGPPLGRAKFLVGLIVINQPAPVFLIDFLPLRLQIGVAWPADIRACICAPKSVGEGAKRTPAALVMA